MKLYLLTSSILLLTIVNNELKGQTIWNGPSYEFKKNDFADPGDKINQDSLSPSVAITRGNNGEIYNAFSETEADKGISPLGTEWAVGEINNIENLTFTSFRTAVVKPKFSVGQKLVCHIINEDIYLSVEFTTWTQGSSGGGFTYTRSTELSTNTNSDLSHEKITVYPNPSTHFLTIMGITQPQHFQVYDLVGSEIIKGELSNNQKLDISHLNSGMYLMKFQDGSTVRFLKK